MSFSAAFRRRRFALERGIGGPLVLLSTFLCLFSVASCRNGHLPHDVKCFGWLPICSKLKGVVVGPARVGAQVVFDCLNAFYKPEVETSAGEKVEWIVEKWRLPTNHTNHFTDDQSRLHLANATKDDGGNYSCQVSAIITSGADPSPLHLSREKTNRTASISWPLKVYAPKSYWIEIVAIFAAILGLGTLFFALLFINQRSLRKKPAESDNRVGPSPSQRRNSTRYGTLDALQ